VSRRAARAASVIPVICSLYQTAAPHTHTHTHNDRELNVCDYLRLSFFSSSLRKTQEKTCFIKKDGMLSNGAKKRKQI